MPLTVSALASPSSRPRPSDAPHAVGTCNDFLPHNLGITYKQDIFLKKTVFSGQWLQASRLTCLPHNRQKGLHQNLTSGIVTLVHQLSLDAPVQHSVLGQPLRPPSISCQTYWKEFQSHGRCMPEIVAWGGVICWGQSAQKAATHWYSTR